MLRIVLPAFLLTLLSVSALGGQIVRFPVADIPDHLTDTNATGIATGALNFRLPSSIPGDELEYRYADYDFLTDTVPVAGNGLSAGSDSLRERKDSVLRSGSKHKKKKTGELYKDSAQSKGFNPRRATLYSAILPGLGQIYNRKYWKLPLVYAAVGIPAYAFFYNKKWYEKFQYAVTVTVNRSPADSVARIDKALLPFYNANDVNGLITNRDSFRKNQDYAVLFFILFYGLQIVDATVDAHLKGFNVNDDLTLKITPTLLSSATSLAGISLVFDIHKPVPRPLRLN